MSCVGGALRDHVAVVDHDDVVGEAVGLFEVLRGEQQRGAVGNELLDHAPQARAPLRVETGGGLVEEQDLAGGASSAAARSRRRRIPPL